MRISHELIRIIILSVIPNWPQEKDILNWNEPLLWFDSEKKKDRNRIRRMDIEPCTIQNCAVKKARKKHIDVGYMYPC